ncbi:hypothetical protein CHLRE_06g292400v5 [Chlamydomonas reinhardtii]|uniref:Uncharacterized protein n=1 Tax=Chlamydomonas reinhardtii TaxID=3055 RepID=A8JFN5_CHLRE|nr:uncharacterized protein CHLRE_06g292400v5 [Chlamydomonas reinhardtii]PNW82748.1 hypothetical protein CHLRE_06g292400v5 [Chlamydomonas reinhardtii]|eukprot:XP_001701609.1 SOUL heme-binding protein [Chlamydomonas reinhardtii]
MQVASRASRQRWGSNGCLIARRQQRAVQPLRAQRGDGPSTSGRGATAPDGATDPEVGAGLKAVWYGAETFGKLVSLARGPQQQQQQRAAAGAGAGKVMDRAEILASIRADYDEQYFVRGVSEMSAYDPQCVFADPFVSFSGTQRFKQNVSNLGGLMSDIKLDVYDWQEGDNTLTTRWRFSCLLDLPWRPRLAAAGGTTHVIDPARGLVVRHEERWEVEPAKVVAQLFTPAAKVPSNAWETFLLSASAGDVQGMWFVLNPLFLKASAALLVASFALSLVNGGEGLLPGPAVVAVQVALGGCLVVEVLKFAQGMQGGETGTGGRF